MRFTTASCGLSTLTPTGCAELLTRVPVKFMAVATHTAVSAPFVIYFGGRFSPSFLPCGCGALKHLFSATEDSNILCHHFLITQTGKSFCSEPEIDPC